LEGSIVNQIEISGFKTEKEAEKFKKKLKTLKTPFRITGFESEEASWKMKEKE